MKRWNWSVVLNLVTLAVLGLVATLQFVSPASAQFSPSDRQPRPVKWEYRSVSTTEETDPGGERFVQEIRDLGDLGFEMVACLYAPDRDRDESMTACYFKRPK
ncbi:hypothetical protein [Baaleninema simplex]|uniref:hypothetical protein n=1 Tax=Baaleninema simplex TaxID=2862350 RepID=UPI00034C2481|nr:hypothetical protein [Baaleninema simplex]